MTHDEFISALMDGFLVHCESVEERFLVLKYLQDNGFRFGSCTATYLGDNTSFDFPNPGWNKHQSEIHCFFPEDEEMFDYFEHYIGIKE